MSTGDYVCNACGGIHVGGGSCYALNARYQYHESRVVSASGPTITVPRDQYELYKEAAESWANEQNVSEKTVYFNDVRQWESYVRKCRQCGCEWNNPPKNVHAADCKAARILGLERETIK